jgi:hypothetical protein
LVTSATYYIWLAGTGQIDPASLGCDFNWPGSAAALAGGILAETMHILTIDHPGANHHIIPNDQCADTPEYTEANMMDCHGPKCALTRCQLGRAHHFLSNNNPVYQRFQVGNNQYSTTEDYCTILDPVIVIANNENITWSTARRLRSNVIIEEGGSLTINCDVGLPENATIIVEQGGTLNIDGAKVYNNCDGTYWGGIIVEGEPILSQMNPNIAGIRHQGACFIRNGASIEGADIGVQLQNPAKPGSNGGFLVAESATFRNCRRSMVFLRDYQNFNVFTNKPIGTRTSFNNCTFTLDNTFDGDFAYFWDMVRFRNVTGIDFHHCQFINDAPHASSYPNDPKSGIQSINAEFSVDGNTSFFSGFGHAISAETEGGMQSFNPSWGLHIQLGLRFAQTFLGATPSPLL